MTTLGPWSPLVAIDAATPGVLGPWSQLLTLDPPAPASPLLWLTADGWVPLEVIAL